MLLKICKKCGVEKLLNEFHRKLGAKFDVRSICKSCRSIEAAEARRTDTFARIKDKIRYESHKEAYAVSSRKWKAKAGRHYLDQQRNYQLANKERIAQRMKLWHIKNRKRNLDRKARWRLKNLESVKSYNALYDRVNSDRGAAKQARRRAQILQATPIWNNEFFMREAYRLAASRTKLFGHPWNVDHIVPLKSNIVCGLHVHCNLRVIPFIENMKKGNRVWPDMPEEVCH